MTKWIQYIDGFNKRIGEAASWASIALVVLVCVDVILRYFFQWSRVWMMELELYFFAIIFLLGGAYAFREDQHVRVDVFYANMSEQKKAWINLFGGILFLLPWCAIMIYISQRYFVKSWLIGERSSQPGGLPGLYIKKALLLIGFFLLFLQGISSVLAALRIIYFPKN